MIQRRFLICLLLVFTVSILYSIPYSVNERGLTSKRTPAFSDSLLKVIKVVDGDTFWAEDRFAKKIKIRLIGIDAPELRKSFKKEAGFYGREAKAYLAKRILGKTVKLEFDIARKDRYGRTLAYAYLPDGTFVNAELIKNGYAIIMTVLPNVRYADEFRRLQQEARKNNRGLWKE